MAWVTLGVAVLLGAALLYLPGLALLRLVSRLPFASAFLFAPAVGGAAIGVLTLIYGWVGIPWNAAIALLSVTVLTVIWVAEEVWRRTRRTGGARKARKRTGGQEQGSDPRRFDGDKARQQTLVWGLVGSAIFAFSYGWVVIGTIGAPGAIPTVGDAHFHMRATQIVLDSGYASPLGPFPDLYPHLGSAPFYPTLWHSLVVPLTAVVPVVEATNAMALLVGLWVWPMGLAAFGSSLGKRLPTQALVAPIMAIPFVLMPGIEVFGFAVYPFVLSVALFAPTLALLVRLIEKPSWSWASAFALGSIGVAAAQPTTALFLLAAVALWLLVLLGVAVLRWWKEGKRGLSSAVLGGTFLALIAAFIVIPRIGIVRGLNNRATEYVGYKPALLNLILGPTYFLSTTYLSVGLLVVALIAAAATLKNRGTVVTVLFSTLLFVLYVAASGPDSYLRIFTSPWWKDASRFAIVGSVLIIGLASMGAAGALHWVAKRTWGPLEPILVGLVAVAGLALTIFLPAKVFWEEKTWFIADSYSRELGTTVELTEDEVALLEQADQYLEPGTIVVGDPDSGLAWLSVLTDLDQFQGMRVPYGEDQKYLGKHFDEILTDPKVCEIVLDHQIKAFLQSDSPSTQHEGWHVGYNQVDTSEGFVLLTEVGGARLYEITACK